MPLDADQVLDIAQARRSAVEPSIDALGLSELAYAWIDHHREHKDRIRKLDNLIAGRWSVLWPDSSATSQAPKIANLIRTDLEDVSKLAGGPEPTVLVDPESESAASQDNAFLRQALLSVYREQSRYKMTRRLLAMDLAGSGLCCVVVWPEYGSNPLQQFPVYLRKDPRHVYPDPTWSYGDELSSLVVAYRHKARILEQAFPGTLAQLFTNEEMLQASQADIDVVEYYDRNECVKVAAVAVQQKRGDPQRRVAVLAQLPNKVGKVMAVLGMRPSFDGVFRGQFDDSIEPLGVANQMLTMHLDHLADMIYSERIVRGAFENPEDFGPGATLFANDPAASIERVPPAGSHPQMFSDIDTLLNMARLSSGVPPSRYGEVRQSIASASFVPASQGHLTTEIDDYQSILADVEKRANSLGLAVDEAYLQPYDPQGRPLRKSIAGMSSGRRFSTTYIPVKDIAGRHDNRVTYGEGSGLDSLNRQVAVLQQRNAGLVSGRWARVQLLKGDVEAIEGEIAKEAVEASVLQGLIQPDVPLEVRLRAAQLLDEGRTTMEMAVTLATEQSQQQAQQQQNVAAQQASLQAGGQPGQAEQLQQGQPTQVLAQTAARTVGGQELPSLAQVLVRGG